jgi:hypothetical protein
MINLITGINLITSLQIVGAATSLGLYHLKSKKKWANRLFYLSVFVTIVINLLSANNMHKEDMRRIDDQNRILTTIKKSIFKLDGMAVSYTLEIPANSSQYQKYISRVDGKVQKVAQKFSALLKKQAQAGSCCSWGGDLMIDGITLSDISPERNPIAEQVEIHEKSPLFPNGNIDGGIYDLVTNPIKFKFYKTVLPPKAIPSFCTAYDGGSDFPKNYVAVKDYKRRAWSPAWDTESNRSFNFEASGLTAKNRKFFYALNKNTYVDTDGLLNDEPKGFQNSSFSTLDDLNGAALYFGSGCSMYAERFSNFNGKIIELSFTIKNGPQIHVDCSKIQSVVGRDGTTTYSYVFPSDAKEFDKLVSPAWSKSYW